MNGSPQNIVERVQRLKSSVDAMLRYWSLYQASRESPNVDAMFASAGIAANGIAVIRNAMTRLVVLNLRRVLEPVGDRPDRWSMMAIMEMLPRDTLDETLSAPLIAAKSGFGTLDRRAEALESCRTRIVARYESPDANWVRRLRDDDIAHPRMGADLWEERSVDQLHQFVMDTADDAYRLCDVIIGSPRADDTYSMAYREAQAFWLCVRPVCDPPAAIGGAD